MDPEIISVEEINYVYNMEVLQPGDILLMNTYNESQRRVMEHMCGSCIYDHVALYIGDAFIIEAEGYGVVMNHIFSRGFKSEKDACVLRLKKASSVTLDNIVYNARSFVGMELDGKEMRMVPKNKKTDKKDSSNHTFCSRLVSQCFFMEGIIFFDNPDYCTPDDFLNSDKLEIIDDSLQPFTSEMEVTVMNAQKQRINYKESTFWAIPFQQFSELYNEDIQTFGQLIAAASRHIDQDSDALKIIEINKLFCPIEERQKEWPWLEKDDDFFHHFLTTEEQLFFLNCQMLHYDLTYIPSVKQNYLSLCVANSVCPNSMIIARIKQGFLEVLNASIDTRKRLAQLYEIVFKRDQKGFITFVDKYGFNSNYKYKATPAIIDHILHDFFRASCNSKS